MPCIILTKVNTVNLAFKDQITELKGNGDYCFLKKFISDIHKRSDNLEKENSIQVNTNKGNYLYRIYPKYIVRTDLNNSKKKYYKIV